MYSDPSGTSPLKWYHWFAIAVGAALVLTGVGAIGGGIYSAATGADFWTSVGQGAALGFGIGAVVGAVAGGIIGYNSWYRLEH